ncbi:Hemin uptake protein HemP [Burkholderiaceae bacterium]|jgi:hemin uptake protein HemP
MDHLPPTQHAHLAPLNGEKKASIQGAQASLAAGAGGLIRLSSAWLFRSAKEIEIEHRGDLYRLRQTALGKLILTK